MARASIVTVALGLVTCFDIVRVRSDSMQPGLDDGDYVVVDRTRVLLYRCCHRELRVRRGDIVVWSADEDRRLFVKRVVALPGERVRLSGGVLFVDGRPQVEPYVKARAGGPGWDETWPAVGLVGGPSEVLVPEGHYFVLGDNRQGSNDSRSYGAVPTWRILGTLSARLPFRRPGPTNAGPLKHEEALSSG